MEWQRAQYSCRRALPSALLSLADEIAGQHMARSSAGHAKCFASDNPFILAFPLPLMSGACRGYVPDGLSKRGAAKPASL
jgi:hypothetical protein